MSRTANMIRYLEHNGVRYECEYRFNFPAEFEIISPVELRTTSEIQEIRTAFELEYAQELAIDRMDYAEGAD